MATRKDTGPLPEWQALTERIDKLLREKPHLDGAGVKKPYGLPGDNDELWALWAGDATAYERIQRERAAAELEEAKRCVALGPGETSAELHG